MSSVSALNLNPFEIHSSLVEMHSQRFAEKFEGTIESSLRQLAPLPPTFRVSFTNLHDGFLSSLFGPVKTKEIEARLVHDFAPGLMSGNNYSCEIPLCVHTPGLFRGTLSSFIRKAFTEAHTKIEDARFLRPLDICEKVRVVTETIAALLRDKKFEHVSVGAIQGLTYLSAAPHIPLVFVDQDEVKTVAGVLENWKCTPWTLLTLSGELSRSTSQAPPLSEQMRVVFFDDLPIIVVSRQHDICFWRTEPNVYRSPLLYDFNPTPEVREYLEPIAALKSQMRRSPSYTHVLDIRSGVRTHRG